MSGNYVSNHFYVFVQVEQRLLECFVLHSMYHHYEGYDGGIPYTRAGKPSEEDLGKKRKSLPSSTCSFSE